MLWSQELIPRRARVEQDSRVFTLTARKEKPRGRVQGRPLSKADNHLLQQLMGRFDGAKSHPIRLMQGSPEGCSGASQRLSFPHLRGRPATAAAALSRPRTQVALSNLAAARYFLNASAVFPW